jgi:hypothetical protein
VVTAILNYWKPGFYRVSRKWSWATDISREEGLKLAYMRAYALSNNLEAYSTKPCWLRPDMGIVYVRTYLGGGRSFTRLVRIKSDSYLGKNQFLVFN